ncbi:MAG TPA: hypothetical protein VF771_12095, partial [Longimicrobiaceae bacterium]
MSRRGAWGMMAMAACASLSGVRAAAQDTTAVRADTTCPVEIQVDLEARRVTRVACVGERDRTPPTLLATPLLAEDHWAVRAAWRAEALGLARFLPAQRAVPRAEVAHALREAAMGADSSPFRDLARGWWARFTEEFPELADGGRAWEAIALLGGEGTVGFERWTGRLAPAIGYSGTRQSPLPLRDVSNPRATLFAGAAVKNASGSMEGAWRGGELVLRQWDVAAGFGAFQLSVGRAPVGYGWGRTGGIVYSDPDPLPRIELESTRPFRLPW